MITIKVPYKTSEDNLKIISDLQRQYSSVLRFAYNRFREDNSQIEIRNKIKSLNNVSDLGSWLTQCAIMQALAIHKKNKNTKVIFGGAKNFQLRLQNKISKEEFQKKRLMPINIQGEKLHKGNRSFDLSKLSNNKLIFKVNRNQHLELNLQKMNKNLKNKLKFIEQMSLVKDLTVTIGLNQHFVYFTYEELKQEVKDLNENRYLGIDLNPNYIGVSIKENDKILHTQCFDFSKLTSQIMSEDNSSESSRFKYLNNKLKHETIQVAKEISLLAVKFKCKFIFVEDLKNISKANLDKGHKLNRLTKNLWKRDYFVQNLKKRIELFNMKFFLVNPMYSSVIGNCQYNYFDPINASLEIARRGFDVIIKKNKKFYPDYFLKDSLKDRWKKHLSELEMNWKELFQQIKSSKLRYRVSFEESSNKLERVFQMNSRKSKVNIYQYLL
jgi:IS605 OrfB family transposase